MTREDAIKKLEEMIKYDWGTYQTKTARIYVNALNMAIEALEQEPVLDKIRAEIETWHKEGTNWSDIRLMNIEDIIKRYKAESEK